MILDSFGLLCMIDMIMTLSWTGKSLLVSHDDVIIIVQLSSQTYTKTICISISTGRIDFASSKVVIHDRFEYIIVVKGHRFRLHIDLKRKNEGSQ